jgi:mannan endo-1,4-beta-mannosidase
MWEQGFWVNLSCHFRNPWTGGPSGNYEDESTTDPWDRRNITDLLTPGTAANTAWMTQLDEVADGLQTLQEQGVIVFWRPLHEMNGDWFWWGGQEPDDFIALWQTMFTYFTETRALHNLIWVYSPNAHFDHVEATYPGNDYVDVVSLDVYMNLDEDPLNINSMGEYDTLVSTGKPMALFEFGAIPATSEGWNTTTYNWTNLIRDIREHYPNVVLVQAWEYVWQLGYNRYQGLSDLVEDPWIITREELPSGDSIEVTPTVEVEITSTVVDFTPTIAEITSTVITNTPTIEETTPTVVASTATLAEITPTTEEVTPTVVTSTPTQVVSTPTSEVEVTPAF